MPTDQNWVAEQAMRSLAPFQQKEVIYAEMGGSMILTRAGWKEAKLGWVFKSTYCAPRTRDTRALARKSWAG